VTTPMSMNVKMITNTTSQVRRLCSAGGKGFRTNGSGVSGPDPSIAGKLLGSHLHTGPCVEEDGVSAGPHYNHEVVTKNKSFPTGEKTYGYTAEVSPNTEVWFDLIPDLEGKASDETTVPFVPVDADGVMSVVVHVRETNTEYGVPFPSQVAGSAGARQACFPLSSVSGVFPATVTK